MREERETAAVGREIGDAVRPLSLSDDGVTDSKMFYFVFLLFIFSSLLFMHLIVKNVFFYSHDTAHHNRLRTKDVEQQTRNDPLCRFSISSFFDRCVYFSSHFCQILCCCCCSSCFCCCCCCSDAAIVSVLAQGGREWNSNGRENTKGGQERNKKSDLKVV